jgi:hypothetical protein
MKQKVCVCLLLLLAIVAGETYFVEETYIEAGCVNLLSQKATESGFCKPISPGFFQLKFCEQGDKVVVFDCIDSNCGNCTISANVTTSTGCSASSPPITDFCTNTLPSAALGFITQVSFAAPGCAGNPIEQFSARDASCFPENGKFVRFACTSNDDSPVFAKMKTALIIALLLLFKEDA